MAYVHQVSFYIGPEQMSELQIGAALERVLAYLRSLLPSQPGFITARALYSVDIPDRQHLIFQSQWELWEDLLAHAESGLAEGKVLVEFGPHLSQGDLVVHDYSEVG
ncbi:MAG: hypothetical protein HPY83_11490 [Anaerolineae bacterium]|nr:hypothetical protein [Anaerolineae bacterium]